jgi:SAM-dependent methyltransferase
VDSADWYDELNRWGADNDFYLDLVRSAASVLDVGCGTGQLLHRARDSGHTGRLCGLDPDPAMLAQAQVRTDIDWFLGDAASTSWDREFDLAVMTGHAFQVLITDDEVRTTLAAVRAALTDGGRFAFETRNPLVQAWERWTPENGTEATNAAGATVRVEHEVLAVEGDVVRLTETFIGAGERHVDTGSLRFLDVDRLAEFLKDAALVVEEQFGDWSRNPLTATSPEIITIARR